MSQPLEGAVIRRLISDDEKVRKQLWMIRLGNRIRRRRLYLGMTREDLSRKSGIGGKMLAAYEYGMCLPTPERLKQICAAMGEPLDEDEVDDA